MATVKALDDSSCAHRNRHSLCPGHNDIFAVFFPKTSWGKQAAPCPGLQAEEPQGFRDRDGAKGCCVQLLAQAGLGVFPLPKEMWLHTA